MERIERILIHPAYAEYGIKNEVAEKDRIFCLHNMEHFLAVARLAWILNLEAEAGIEKEWIYAAALLHDIGRHRQYQDGTPHEEESARLAPAILLDCGFSDKETGVIISAIQTHRDAGIKNENNLNGILYRADKLSRACFACRAADQCNWKSDKKNLQLEY